MTLTKYWWMKPGEIINIIIRLMSRVFIGSATLVVLGENPIIKIVMFLYVYYPLRPIVIDIYSIIKRAWGKKQ